MTGDFGAMALGVDAFILTSSALGGDGGEKLIGR
jgi:hypothetical protein